MFANPGIDMQFDWLDDNPVTSQQHGAFGCERRNNASYRWTINNWSNGDSGGIRGELFTGIYGYNLDIQNGSNFRIVIDKDRNRESYGAKWPNRIQVYKNGSLTREYTMTAGRTDTTPQDYYNGNHFCLFGQ